MVLRRIRIEDELRRVWIELYLYKDTPVMRNERQGYGRHILLETLDLDFRSRFLERSPLNRENSKEVKVKVENGLLIMLIVEKNIGNWPHSNFSIYRILTETTN